MRRTQVLCILKKLDPDVQKIVFRLIYPDRKEIQAYLTSQGYFPERFEALDRQIVDFAHEDEWEMITRPLDAAERKFVHIRCTALRLVHRCLQWDRNRCVSRMMLIAKPHVWWFDDTQPAAQLRWAQETQVQAVKKTKKKFWAMHWTQ